jgi:formate/nitrite transporter
MASPAFDSPIPADIVKAATEAGAKKATLPVDQMLVRGALSGLLLGVATSFMIFVNITSWGKAFAPVLGAVYFPVGFVVLVLMGCELVTGNMALIPMAVYAGKATVNGLVRNWSWVALGNLIGSLMYACLFWAVYTSCGTKTEHPLGTIGAAVKGVAVNKTLVYEDIGLQGWITALVKAICCNWMVTMGTMMSFASKSTVGRIVAMWIPIMIFIAHGFEHAVVNFYVIPCGMMFGAPVSIFQWLFWNQIPVILGNIIGGCALTAIPFAYAYPVPRGDAKDTSVQLMSAA